RGPTAAVPPSSNTLIVGKHAGENPNTTPSFEAIGYIVVEAGTGSFGGAAWEAGLGSASAQGLVSGVPASYPIAKLGPTSTAVLSQSGMADGDGSWAVLPGPDATTGSSLLVNVDEDTIGDAEREHAAEQVAYFIVNQCPDATKGSACGNGGACR